MKGTEMQFIPAVTVTSLSPALVSPNQTVNIYGSNFGNSALAVTVLFHDQPASVISVTPTNIQVAVPAINASGNITVKVAGQAVIGPAYTYIAPIPSSPIRQLVLSTQAKIDSFVAANQGKPVDISGNLIIGGQDVTSVAGLSNITSISGRLSIVDCPKLTTLSLLGNAASIGLVDCSLASNLERIELDGLTTTGGVSFSGCKQLKAVSLKSLREINGALSFNSCLALSDVNLKGLKRVSGKMYLISTGLIDCSGFSALESCGALSVQSNAALSSFRGMEQLTALTMPALFSSGMQVSLYIRLNGLFVEKNAGLTSLSGLQNVRNVPVIYINNNTLLNDVCPLKHSIVAASGLPDLTFRYQPYIGNSGPNPYVEVSMPALTLSSNGALADTKDALAVLSACP